MSDALSSLLKETKRICEAATPGPWHLSDDQNSVHQHIYQGEFEEVCNVDSSDLDGYQKNSAFIAHAREVLPRLVAALERAICQRDAARELLDDEYTVSMWKDDETALLDAVIVKILTGVR